jgi:REP element-mobilizing transposase RayT
MPNHFHFLIKIKEQDPLPIVTKNTNNTIILGSKKLTPIEKAFKDFFISYAKSINKANGRTGSLFQPRFKKKKITDNAYFTTIIQYIHANPIKSKLCSDYSSYKFSSYNAIINSTPTKIKRQKVLEWFGNREQFLKIH